MLIPVTIRGQLLTAQKITLAEKSLNKLFCKVDADEEWDGLAMRFIFRSINATGVVEREVVPADINAVRVPPECIRAGHLFITAIGVAEEGTVRLTTADMPFGLEISRVTALAAGVPDNISPAQFEQLLSLIGTVSKLDTNAKNLADAINEVLQHFKTGHPVAQAFSDDGKAYTAKGNDLPVLQEIVGIAAQVIFIPTLKNTVREPTLALNGGKAYPIKIRNPEANSVVPSVHLPVPVGALMAGLPYLLTFSCGCWFIDSWVGSTTEHAFTEGLAHYPDADICGIPIFDNLYTEESGKFSLLNILRTPDEEDGHPGCVVEVPSIGTVQNIVKKIGAGWVDVTEDFLQQQKPAEEYLRSLPQGRWELRDGHLYRAENVEGMYGEKMVLLSMLTDDPFLYTMLFVNDELILNMDSEVGKAELFGEKVWIGEGGRTYAQAEEPKDAPDGSLWWDIDGDTTERGIRFFYEEDEEPKDAPNGAVWLGPKEESDDIVPAWAKKPEPPKLSELVNDAGFVTAKDLPSGGSDKWEFIGEFNVGDEDVAEWRITEDAEGNPIELKEAFFEYIFQPAANYTADTQVYFGNPAWNQPFEVNAIILGVKVLKSTVVTQTGPKSEHFIYHRGKTDEFSGGGCSMVMRFAHGSIQAVSWSSGVESYYGHTKNCLGGLAMKTANAETSLIGANSTIKLWGVRI